MILSSPESILSFLKTHPLESVVVIHEPGADLTKLSKLLKKKKVGPIHFVPLNQGRLDGDASPFNDARAIILWTFDPQIAYTTRYQIVDMLFKSNRLTPPIYGPSFSYQPLQEDKNFQKVIANVNKKFTFRYIEQNDQYFQAWRYFGVFQLLRHALKLQGDCVEFGVLNGHSTALLAETMEFFNIKNKTIYCFDTWAGMPSSNPGADPYYKKGDFSQTSLELVKKNLAPWGDRIQFVPGDICKTAKDFFKTPLCFIRIDVDLYEPTKVCLEETYDQMVPGGVIYLDDYVQKETVGERIAVDDFLSDKKERPFYMVGDRAYLLKDIG